MAYIRPAAASWFLWAIGWGWILLRDRGYGAGVRMHEMSVFFLLGFLGFRFCSFWRGLRGGEHETILLLNLDHLAINLSVCRGGVTWRSGASGTARSRWADRDAVEMSMHEGKYQQGRNRVVINR